MPYEIGDDELIGEDEVEALLGFADRFEIGAPRRRATPVRRSSALQQAMAMRQAQAGTLLRQSQPTKGRMYPLPFDSIVTIAAGAVVTVNSQPQVIFRPERLVLGTTVAASFLILDIRVGKNSQLAQAGAIPGEAFGPNAFGVRLKCDTAQISNIVALQVQNNSGGALRFLGTFFGEAVE